MDTIFTLPLFVFACIQAFISLLLLVPRLNLPVAQYYKGLRKGPAANAVIYTVAGALALLTLTSFFELLRGMERVKSGNLRGDVMAVVDYLRAQVSCVLSASNLLLLLLNIALSGDKCQLDSTLKNLEAFKRQVKGLQTEYERATKTSTDAPASTGEAQALKKQVTQLIQDKQQSQGALETAQKAAKSAEAKVAAMMSQVKGLDTEYDRVLEENKLLKRKLAQYDTGSSYQEPRKKDD